MKSWSVGHALDGPNISPLACDPEYEAGEHRLSVEQHGTHAAFAKLTPVLGTGQPDVFSQHLEQGLV
jgi:hypothetical protein